MISVLHDPLFKVERKDGSIASVGLKELLTNAQDFTDLHGRTPTGRYALLRLCIAFLCDIFHPETVTDRREMFRSGSFDAAAIESYFTECDRKGPRFLLDDAVHPFMQMPYVEELDAKYERPVASMFMDIPSGNNHIHLDHRLQDEHVFSVQDAFEAMIETYAFCPAGLAGPSAVNNTNPYYSIIRGSDLFHTFVLNMVSEEELINIPYGIGDVPWRKDAVVLPRQEISSVTCLGALTFMPRRIGLVIDDDGLVRKVYLQAGNDFRGDGRWMDPFVPYRKKQDDTFTTIKPELGRQVWRDAGGLLPDASASFRPPVQIMNMPDIVKRSARSFVEIELTGMATKQAALLGSVYESLRMPEALLTDKILADEFRKYIDLAETLNRSIERCINDSFAQSVAQQASEHFLALAKDHIFGSMLQLLLNDEPDEESAHRHRQVFDRLIVDDITDTIHTVLDHCGTSVEQLRKQAIAARFIIGSTYKTLKESENIEQH